MASEVDRGSARGKNLLQARVAGVVDLESRAGIRALEASEMRQFGNGSGQVVVNAADNPRPVGGTQFGHGAAKIFVCHPRHQHPGANRASQPAGKVRGPYWPERTHQREHSVE